MYICFIIFLYRLKCFTQHRYEIEFIWQTRKIKSMFKLKDKNYHKSHLVYEGQCSCGEKYIGETQRNFSVQINEHQTNPNCPNLQDT